MKPPSVAGIIDQLVNSKLDKIWFQQGADFGEYVRRLKAAGKTVVTKKCLLMYVGQATGLHAVHKFFAKALGKY